MWSSVGAWFRGFHSRSHARMLSHGYIHRHAEVKPHIACGHVASGQCSCRHRVSGVKCRSMILYPDTWPRRPQSFNLVRSAGVP